MTKIEEIIDFVLTSFKEENIEDTTDNRLAFLEGPKNGWEEDGVEGLT